MNKRGFIFSLDAFIAFLLTMMTISLLLFTIGTPKAFYPSLEQAHQLAHDTLYALASTTDDPSQGSYLEQSLSGSADTVLPRVAGGIDSSGNTVNGIVPRAFGYKLERYTFDASNPGVQQKWELVYDSGPDASGACPPGSDRCDRAYSKLSASSTIFASLYKSVPNPGRSPFCYLSCHGFDPRNPPSYQQAEKCDITPCGVQKSNFDVGDNSIQMVRFTVYT